MENATMTSTRQVQAREGIAARFARETTNHEMTVLHDDGLYRHLRFRASWWQPPLARKQTSSMYWFDLITAPGMLLFQGDGESFQFRRIEDMFEFFRGPAGRINPGYWAEKIVDGRDRLRKYDRDLFVALVKERFVNAARSGGVPAGTGRAIRADLLDVDSYGSPDTYCEEGARQALADFEHEGFRFDDTWEWDLQDYDWWFLWALHGIVWGIAQYDSAARADGRPDAARAQDVVTVAAAGGRL
jgi:hypothetical protein